MERLTEFRKDLNRYEYKQDEKGYCYISEGQIVNKLGKLEDLEEQIGCPLEIVFKALTNGVWVEVSPIDINFENSETMYLEDFVILEKKLDGTLCLNARDYVDELELKDYKKTWWLKADRSE